MKVETAEDRAIVYKYLHKKFLGTLWRQIIWDDSQPITGMCPVLKPFDLSIEKHLPELHKQKPVKPFEGDLWHPLTVLGHVKRLFAIHRAKRSTDTTSNKWWNVAFICLVGLTLLIISSYTISCYIQAQ